MGLEAVLGCWQAEGEHFVLALESRLAVSEPLVEQHCSVPCCWLLACSGPEEVGLAGAVVEAAFASGEHPSVSAYLAGLDRYGLAPYEPGLVGFAFAALAGSSKNSSSSGELHCAIVHRTLE